MPPMRWTRPRDVGHGHGLALAAALLLAVGAPGCGADRRAAGGPSRPAGAGGGGGGGGEGEGDGEGEGEGGGEGEGEGGGDDEIVGGIVLPDCADRDRDGYGQGAGCRGADLDDGDATIFPGARERCDGKDNDGDGLVDNQDGDFSPDPCPLRAGVCSGKNADCIDGASQPCTAEDYGVFYVVEEGRFDRQCDGRDNDCDERIDEECECADGTLAVCPDDACADRSCADGRWGPCLRTRNPEPETCDGVDNDCDGTIDEPEGEFQPPLCGRCPFEMMLVDLPNLDLCIDRWEASRPDASRASPGQADAGAAMSRPGVLPWTVIDRAEALGACRRANKDLCTVAQWRMGCRYEGQVQLDPDWIYPYGRVHDGGRCNGADAGRGQAAPTGDLAECVVPSVLRGAYDLSGNVAEWVDERIEGQRAVLGGSYLSEGEAMTCEAQELLDATAEELHIGFRCCKGLNNQ